MEIKTWLQKHSIGSGEFAERLGVSAARMSNMITGRRFPSFRLMLQVMRESGGEITADDIAAPFLRRAIATGERFDRKTKTQRKGKT